MNKIDERPRYAMLRSLKLRRFRGIEALAFQDLGRANLLIGANNTGKTCLLEALVLLFGDADLLARLPRLFRQDPADPGDWHAYWPLLARRSRGDFLIEADGRRVAAHERDGGWRVERSDEKGESADILHWSPGSGGEIRGAPGVRSVAVLSTAQPDPSETAKLYLAFAPGRPALRSQLQDLLRKAIEPRLRSLEHAPSERPSAASLRIDLGDGPPIPFTQMGRAFARALHLFCLVFARKPDLLLVDEIENGLYFGGLRPYWTGLLDALNQENVQLFATTHSRECMEAAQRADRAGGRNAVRYLRLDRRAENPDVVVGTCFDGETMAQAVEFDQEMR